MSSPGSRAGYGAVALVLGCLGSPPAIEGGTEADGTATASASATDSTGTVDDTGDPCAACAAEDDCIEGMCVAPGCGDGTVDEGEECDLGMQNAQTGSCKVDCTLQFCGDGEVGPVETCDDANDVPGDGCHACVLETCGDGQRDPGEECDDGNAEDGDGCNSNCRPSGEVVWEDFHDGAMSSADRANDVALLHDDRRVVVVGGVVDDGGNPERWIRILDTDGGFVFTSPAPDDGDQTGQLYGVDCGLTCIAVGTQLVGEMDIAYVVLQRILPSGTPGEAVMLANNDPTLGRQGYGVTLAPVGADIVGTAQVAVGLQDHGYLEHVDEALSSESYADLLTGQGHAVLRRVARTPTRLFASGWREAVGMGPTEAFVVSIGGPKDVAMATIGGLLHTLALSVAPLPDNSFIVAGTKHDGMGAGAAVLRRYDDNFGLVWNKDSSFDGARAQFDDVEIAANGDIVAVGAVLETGSTTAYDLLVVRTDPEGNRRWQRVFADPGHDVAFGVDLDADTGAIYVAGQRTLNGTEDAWIARLTP